MGSSGPLTPTRMELLASGSSCLLCMYDVDGNGTIELAEMKRVVGAVYDMLGTQEHKRGTAEELFSKMDQNSDGTVPQDQFIAICMKDQDLLTILTKGSS